jgi:hypothetical protein
MSTVVHNHGFEPKSIRSVTRRIWLGRLLRLSGWIFIPPLLVLTYLFCLALVFGMSHEWSSWRTGTPVETEAVIVAKKKEQVGTSMTRVVKYEFEVDGKTWSGTATVSRSQYETLAIGERIKVAYVDSAPDVNDAEIDRRRGSGLVDYGFFLGAVFFLFMPFYWLYQRLRGVPSDKANVMAQLRMARTLTQTDFDPAPRAIFDHRKEHRFPQEDIRKESLAWLGWDGRFHPALCSAELSHPETFLLTPTKESYRQRIPLEEFLARVDYVYSRGFRRYRNLDPIDTSMPPRIKGPDDPLLEEEDSPIPDEQEREFHALTVLRRLTGESEIPPGDFDSFRLELNGLEREEAIDHTEYQEQELKKEIDRLKKKRKEGKIIERILVTCFGRILMEEYEAFLDRVSPRAYPFIISRGDTEETLTSLRVSEAVVFVHDLLYFFYCCPWRWKPVDREVELEMQDGSVCPVRFSFVPGVKILVERI